MEVRNFFWPSTGFKIFLAPWFCSSYSITTVVVLKFPGPMVLFIIRYHNSRSLKIFLAQWFCSSYDTTIVVVLKFSWPQGFVHHTVSQQYHNSSGLNFPGPMVLFIIRYHNSRSLKIFLAQWFCSPYDITIAVVLKLSWPPGFVHHTVSQQ